LDSRHKTILKTLLGSGILLGFAVFIQAYIGWAALLAPWRSLAAGPLAGAIILVFLSYGLRAWRVYDYFQQPMAGRFGLCLRLSLQHNLLNNLLPMRTGEVGFPVLMARYFDIPARRSLPALLWFRLLDLHTLLTLGLVIAGGRLLGGALTLLLTALWLLVPWLAFRLYRPWLGAIGQRPGRLWALLRDILHSLPHDAGHFWRAWLWTVLNWLVKLAVFAWVLQRFAALPWAAAWVGVAAGDLTSVLPIHGVAGAGTYEAGVVAGLVPFRVDAATALQAAVNLHLFVLGCTLLSGVVSLLLPRGAARNSVPPR
jgi:uncharacterized membrane protein YbhN (UPF0104 family)